MWCILQNFENNFLSEIINIQRFFEFILKPIMFEVLKLANNSGLLKLLRAFN